MGETIGGEKTKHETINNKTNFNKLNTSTMKKSIYIGIIALATMLMTSCSNDEVYQSLPQDDAIEFGTYLGRDVQSRGVVTDNDFIQFGVFAFYTGGTQWATASTTATPNFMYNQEVNKSGTAWEYTPKKYWPTKKEDKITFFAYAPMASAANGIAITDNDAIGTPEVTYTIDEENLDKMADFVADALIDEVRSGESNDAVLDDNDEEVTKFTLNHELTRINIQAKLSADAYGVAAADKTKVNITDIQFTGTGFATTGTYTFAQTDDTRGSWDYTAAATPVSIFNTSAASANFVNWALPSEFGTYNTKGVAVPSKTLVPLFKTNEYLFLIPANGLTGTDASHEVEMHVYYDIVTYDAALVGQHSKTSAVKGIKLPVGLLKQGTAYNLTLTFGMNEIVLSAEVADWLDANPEEDVDWTDIDK